MWSSQNGSGPFCAHLASEFDSLGTRYRQASVDVLLPFSRSVIDSAIGFLLATAAVFGSVDPVSFTQSRHVLGHPPAQHVGRVRKERLIFFFSHSPTTAQRAHKQPAKPLAFGHFSSGPIASTVARIDPGANVRGASFIARRRHRPASQVLSALPSRAYFRPTFSAFFDVVDRSAYSRSGFFCLEKAAVLMATKDPRAISS